MEYFQSFWIKDCDFAAGEFDETLALKVSNIISKIDGTPTESMQSYYTYLQTKKQGENLTITVLRKNSDGEYAEKDYKVTVGER